MDLDLVTRVNVLCLASTCHLTYYISFDTPPHLTANFVQQISHNHVPPPKLIRDHRVTETHFGVCRFSDRGIVMEQFLCDRCNGMFESRNRLFAHLRSSACSPLPAEPPRHTKLAFLFGFDGASLSLSEVLLTPRAQTIHRALP